MTTEFSPIPAEDVERVQFLLDRFDNLRPVRSHSLALDRDVTLVCAFQPGPDGVGVNVQPVLVVVDEALMADIEHIEKKDYELADNDQHHLDVFSHVPGVTASAARLVSLDRKGLLIGVWLEDRGDTVRSAAVGLVVNHAWFEDLVDPGHEQIAAAADSIANHEHEPEPTDFLKKLLGLLGPNVQVITGDEALRSLLGGFDPEPDEDDVDCGDLPDDLDETLGRLLDKGNLPN